MVEPIAPGNDSSHGEAALSFSSHFPIILWVVNMYSLLFRFFVTFCYGHAYWLYYRYSDDDGGGDDDDDDDDRHCNVRPFFHQSTPWMETNEGSRLGAVVLGQRNAQEHFGRVGSLCKSKCVCGFSISWNLEIYMIFLYFSAISAPTCSKCSTSSGDVWSICRETPVSLPVRALVLKGFHINRRRI